MPRNISKNYVSIFENVEIFDISQKYLTAVLVEDIPGMKFQIHHLNFEEYFIQQKGK